VKSCVRKVIVCSAVGRGIGVGYLKCCVDTIQLHRGQDRNVGHLEPETPSYLHLTQDERVGIDSPEKHLGGAGLAECRPSPSCSPSDPWPRTPHWALDEECKLRSPQHNFVEVLCFVCM
jgi:hypothetical protein